MARTQSRGRGTDQQRTQSRAREQSQRLRHELDLLADPETFADLPGVGTDPPPPDADRFDEADGDDLIDDESEGRDDEPVAPSRTVRDLLGTQPPVAVLRLVVEAGEVRALPLLAPRPALRGAIDELVALAEAIFRRGRETLTDDEWRTLTEAGSPCARLLLLSRIAIAGTDKVAVGEGATFQPNNRGLERYAGKLALLPDGTAFSLRLLLGGGKSGRRSNAHPFGDLPEAVKLLALRKALAREAAEGVARSDDEFRASLNDALRELGLDLPRPDWKHVEMLRSNLVRRGLPEVFPKRSERQRRYDSAP